MNRTIPLALLLLSAAAADAPGQSLWRQGRANYVPLVADNRAHGVGDIITIVVDEQQDVNNTENVKLEKDSNASAAIPTFTPYQEIADEVFPIEWSYQREFEGKADFRKQGDFSTLLTATVVDVHPNGNLVIEGRRKIVLDGEEKWMTVSGVVRPFDVQPENTVRSALVANATVTYQSCGPLARTTRPGWLEKILDFLWPF